MAVEQLLRYREVSSSLITGVVVLMDKANVTFQRCYFKNTYHNDLKQRVLQIFSPGNTIVSFKAKNVFNMRKLQGSTPIVIHTSPYSTAPEMHDGEVIIHGEIELTCPVGYRFVSSTISESLNESSTLNYLEFVCVKCPYKTYSLQRGGFSNHNFTPDIECHDCPRAAVCTGDELRPRPNFWGNRNPTNGEVSFLNCPLGYCCQNDHECKKYNSCHSKRNGILCGRCEQGTSELLFGTECKPNEECDSRSFFIGLSIFVPLYCMFFLYYGDLIKYLTSALFTSSMSCTKQSRDSHTQSHSTKIHSNRMFCGSLKIIFYYYQIIYIFNSSVAGPGEAFKMINNFLTPIFSLLVSANVFGIKCSFKSLQPIHKIAILHSLGFLLLLFTGFLIVVWNVIIAFKHSRLNSKPLYLDAVVQSNGSDVTSGNFQDINLKTGQSFKCRIASAFIQICLLMYASSAQLCLSLLCCVPIGEQNVLFIDGNLECYQTFQYIAMVYVVINIIPFCLVLVLGSYLLAFDSISLTAFCLGCIFPLPFCINWAWLLLKRRRGRTSHCYTVVSSELEAMLGDGSLDADTNVATPRSAMLQVLLGPFRSHSPFLYFPESPIPWEGFLVFRRLVIILLYTFVYDVNLRMSLVLLTCVVILVFHLVVQPFKRKSENVLETISLITLTILCWFTYVSEIFNGGDKTVPSFHPHLLSLISIVESVLIVTPFLASLLVVFIPYFYGFIN